MIRTRIFFLLIPSLLAAQDETEQIRTRRIWDTNFQTARPAESTPAAAAPAKTAAHSRDDAALVGVTIWRMRQSTPADARAVRALIHEAGEQREYTPERVRAGTPLTEGQKVRIGIETARAGYLYVVDQEEYADGSRGDAYLIFPTMRTRSGMNKVAAGVVTEIPAATDDPPYFRVERTRADQAAELLTILVSPSPIAGLRTGAERLKLVPAQLAEWEKKWAAKSFRLDAPRQAGKAYTVAEKEAAAGKTVLTAKDPLPQTMYRVEAKSGAPVLIHLPLPISK
jgi:hypothetical protein